MKYWMCHKRSLKQMRNENDTTQKNSLCVAPKNIKFITDTII